MTEGAVIVGKFYQVPCVLALKRAWCGAIWLPVVGPLHEDHGPVNFPWPHWHIDWRFAPERAYEYATVLSVSPYGRPIQEKEQRAWRGEEYDCKDLVDKEAGVQLRKMKCKRELPAYPLKAAKWLPELNKQFAGCKAKDGICPHRGLPLVGHTADGVTTCPGHGLRWRVDTGELVT